MRAPKSPVERYMSERILSFAYLMCPSVCRPNELKNMSVICHIQFQWKVTEHFWNRIWSVHKKSLSLKKYFERKNLQTCFCCLCANLPTVKIWEQSDKFPMSFSFLQGPLQVKNWTWENGAKYVNQMANFYFRPKLKTAISLPILNLFQWFLFLPLEISFGSLL